jgi:hypothetical protein
MNRKFFLAIAPLATSLLVSPLVYAAPAGIDNPIHAMFRNESKSVKLNLRNDSGAPIELKVNDQIMTLEAGKSLGLKLPVGTRIITNTATPAHPAGSLITQVIKEHDGATITIR